ncbi:hypothetical protein [Azospirillum soli]|uniref:hypothetical protein n=1 Tax=Azospirillum soli TaxID=1304799 RepID=UPI001AE362BC|nr:hypothetical protein [Azospirillum soli]MBP2315443.1 hypothetical protein [Azospirillum soli]
MINEVEPILGDLPAGRPCLARRRLQEFYAGDWGLGRFFASVDLAGAASRQDPGMVESNLPVLARQGFQPVGNGVFG